MSLHVPYDIPDVDVVWLRCKSQDLLRGYEMSLVKQKATPLPKYLKWVKTLPCALCGGPGGDAHHLVGVGHMGGMGMKAPDLMTSPLCRECHGRVHREPELWTMQWEWIARTLLQAQQEGILSAG